MSASHDPMVSWCVCHHTNMRMSGRLGRQLEPVGYTCSSSPIAPELKVYRDSGGWVMPIQSPLAVIYAAGHCHESVISMLQAVSTELQAAAVHCAML